MPTYDYVCSACDHRFELFQSIKADPERTCPQCGRNKLRRLIGPGAALLFRGSGFYITDYRSTSYREKAKAETGGNGAAPASDSKSGGANSTKSQAKGCTSGKGPSAKE